VLHWSPSFLPSKDGCTKWMKKHKTVRSAAGISPNFRPWTEPPAGTPSPALRGVPNNPRFRDCIDIAWAHALKKPEAERLPLYCNFSQCPSRKPWSQSIRCLTTSTKYYDFSRDTVISPEETLLVHGFPAPELSLDMFSEKDLVHAVGETMSLPCVGAIMLGLFLNPCAPWWVRETSDV
jgi:hypothetical protein